jgi:PAS domain S-box-containing protein
MVESTVKPSSELVVGLTERTPITVLHVDDEAGFLTVAKQILEMQGAFEVETAVSVKDAMKKMETKMFDVIVSDYVMPEKGGLEFLKELRDSGNNVPFIMFTGKGREDIAIKALNLGADRYFNKIGGPETVYGELAHGIHQAVETKRAEMEILRREERLRAILASSPDAIIISDLNANVVDCNKETLKLTGFASKEEVIGRNSLEFIAERDRNRALENLKKTLEQGTVRSTEYTLLKKDGEEYQGELSASIIKDSSDNPIGFVGIVRDITERKRLEEVLRKSEENYRSIVELAPDGIITANTKGVVTSVNTAFTRITGFSKDEIIGKHFTKVGTLRKKDSPKYLKLFTSLLRGKTPKPFVAIWKHKDGTTHPTEIHIALMKSNGKTIGFQAIARDITERSKTGEELRKTKNYLANLLNYANAPIIVWDNNKRITVFNNAFEVFTGYKKESMLRRNIGVLFPPLQKEEILQTIEKATKGEKWKSVEIPILCKDKETKIALWNSANIADKEGKRISTIAQGQDITERKKAEKVLKTTLEKVEVLNEKLGVVGTLTRHDARNKLSTVTMNAFLAKQKLPGDHEVLKHLNEIESACWATERIFDFATIYEKIGMEELIYMDAEKTLEEAVTLRLDLKGIKVVNDCKGLAVLADSLLRQLFYNMIDNSLKYGEKVSQIRVYYEESGKDKLKLVYEDDGAGIPKAEKEKIFEESYGKGTGYGLYLIKKTCEVYGWTIRETGKPGKGAQFTITIPKTSVRFAPQSPNQTNYSHLKSKQASHHPKS